MINELWNHRNDKDMRNKGILVGVLLASAAFFALLIRWFLRIRDFKRNADVFNFVNANTVSYKDKEFGDECIASMYSATKVDLREVVPARDPMNLCIKGISSYLTIIVPQEWNVKAQGTLSSSRIQNIISFDRDNYDAPLLFINYSLKRSFMKIMTVKEYDLQQEVLETMQVEEEGQEA